MTVTALPAMPAPPDLSHTPWRAIWLSERFSIWCLVDLVDYEWLTANNWNISWGSGAPWKAYAKRNVGRDRATVRMHREIMLRADPDGYGPKLVVDHINGQPLDNRRDNLRWVTQSQNDANRRLRHLIPALPKVLTDLLEAAPMARELERVPF